MSAKQLPMFVMTLVALLVVGSLPVAASGPNDSPGSVLSVQMDKDSASLVAGDWVEFSTVLHNDGTTPTPALVAHLNIASMRKGPHVDLEDWSPERTQWVASIPPGDSVRLTWTVHALLDGDFAAFVTVVSSDRSSTPVAGSSLFIHAEPDKILPLNDVIPVVSLVPVFPLALLVLAVVHRSRRSAAASPLVCV